MSTYLITYVEHDHVVEETAPMQVLIKAKNPEDASRNAIEVLSYDEYEDFDDPDRSIEILLVERTYADAPYDTIWSTLDELKQHLADIRRDIKRKRDES